MWLDLRPPGIVVKSHFRNITIGETTIFFNMIESILQAFFVKSYSPAVGREDFGSILCGRHETHPA